MIWVGGFGGGPGLTGLLITLFFFALNVTGLLLVLRYYRKMQRGATGTPPPVPQNDPWSFDGEEKSAALRILEERYARGEIDRDEFLQRRADLLGD